MNINQAEAVKKIAQAVIELIDTMLAEEHPHFEQMALTFPEEQETPEEKPQAKKVTRVRAFPADVATVKYLMVARGYKTPATLAKVMNCGQATIYAMFKRGTCSRKMMHALESALGVAPGTLWLGSGR